VLEEIERAGLLERVRTLGSWMERELNALKLRCPGLTDVRGAGLMWGLELDRDAGPVAGSLLDMGFVVGTAQGNVIRILPPYVVPKSALKSFLTAIERTLSEETH